VPIRVEARRLLLTALLLGTACARAAPFEPAGLDDDRLGAWTPDATATILHQAISKLDDPALVVVSDPSTWRALWTQAWGGIQLSPALPGVDFVLSSVIVVALGKRSGLGYSVTIDSVVVRTVGAVLYATELQPGAHCDTGAGDSAPVHMVLAPGHPPNFDWRVTPTRRDCATSAPRP